MDRATPLPQEASPTPQTAPLDWNEARELAIRTVQRVIWYRGRETVEDVAHEALRQYLLRLRKETPRDPRALLAEIARRRSIDHIRRPIREELLDPERSASLPAEVNARGFELEPLVYQFFAQSGDSPCAELARHFFMDQPWAPFAAAVGREVEAVRQQWSRCTKKFRAAVLTRPEFQDFREWAAEER